MSYQLKELTIRTNNTQEGMGKIQELWDHIMSGKLPILFDSEHIFLQGISLVSRYSNYDGDENGDYDLSILGVTSDFFQEMDKKADAGIYKKYEVSDDSKKVTECTRKAWEKVWKEQKNGDIHRVFTCDYESSVPPEYAKDKKAHCYLYIAVHQ